MNFRMWRRSIDLRIERLIPAENGALELPPGGTLEDTSRVSAAAAAILVVSPTWPAALVAALRTLVSDWDHSLPGTPQRPGAGAEA